jgi:hypothetical protein
MGWLVGDLPAQVQLASNEADAAGLPYWLPV